MGVVCGGAHPRVSRMGCKNSHFQPVPRCCCCYWFRDPTLRTVVLDTEMRVYDDSSLTPPCSLDKSVVGNLPSPPEKSTSYLEALTQRIPSPIARLSVTYAGPSVFTFTFCWFNSTVGTFPQHRESLSLIPSPCGASNRARHIEELGSVGLVKLGGCHDQVILKTRKSKFTWGGHGTEAFQAGQGQIRARTWLPGLLLFTLCIDNLTKTIS